MLISLGQFLFNEVFMAKYIEQVGGRLQEKSGLAVSAGAADAGKIPELNGSGRLDNSMMPVGIGADTQVIVASEALAAGDFVNIHNSSGPKVRKADGATPGKEAHGFVLALVANGGNATVYFEGTNTQTTGQTPGIVFLSASAPGQATNASPNTSGQIVQQIGLATSATTINFQFQQPITLA
jgi:hypothetical protein